MKIRGIYIAPRWIVVGVGILLALLLLGYLLFPGNPDIPPQKAISQAILATSGEPTYEYNIRMLTLIDGKEHQVSNVRGQRENQNRIHIKGQIFDLDVDFYQIENTTYTKDQMTGEWITISDNQINQQEIFMQELNPLVSFTYKELNDAKYTGTKKIDGRRLWVYTARPVVDNQYMELLWKDFEYVFWIEPRTLLIYNAKVTAVSKNKPADRLTLAVEFRNYNGDIEVKPPVGVKQKGTPKY